ncbi:F-box protein CPR1-like [Mercurialis annua]|uniref:F-box protein CPR1-like n=1 Tax=Mercurialis annua TaxID=3986 RepID=UPI00215FD65D|nr:F-box protein CPR1-like [Mercurialis annua]
MKNLRRIAAELPIDVVSCILSHLPVKSVLRFKCVSKSWYSLISDPHFKRLHLLHSHKSANLVLVLKMHIRKVLSEQLHLLYYYGFCDATFFDDIISGDSSQIELPFRRPLHLCDGMILCSCDGLLLTRNQYNNFGHLTLWNPSTRERRELPPLQCDYPSKSAALGYDSSTDDYKVLFVPLNGNRLKDVMILSLKTNCWREVKDFKCYRLENGVSLNGSLAFLQHSVVRYLSAKIVCFSLANESTTEMEHPRNCHNYGRLNLGVLQGCLCLTETAFSNCSMMTVWLMKEFGVTSSWTKLITIPNMSRYPTLISSILLPLDHMNETVFLIHNNFGFSSYILIINNFEAEDYRFVKIAELQEDELLTGLAYIRTLTSPN